MIRIFRHYIPRSLVVLGTAEAVILVGAVYLGITIRLLDFNPTDKLLVGHIWTRALLFAGLIMLVMAGMGLYQRGLRDDLRGIYLRLALAFLLSLGVLLGMFYLFRSLYFGNFAFVVAFVTAVVGITLFRTLVYQFAENDLFRRRVLVLGAGQAAAQIERLRRKSDWRDRTLVGFVHIRGEDEAVTPERIVHVKTSLRHLAAELDIHEIVVAVDERRESFPVNEVLDCKMSGILVIDLVTFLEQATGKITLDALNPSTLIFADGFIQAVIKGYIHRLFDLTVSLAMLAITWPVMLLTAVAIVAESGGRGPVFYKQIRVGRHGRPFEILKFRSMRVDAEVAGKPQWAKSNDSRITRVGAFIRKTRIDELPQLLNVLRGQMSFVGPRPERPEFVEELSKKIPYFDLRHRVNPGITGWAQICYPYGASEEDAKEKLQYDLYYIKNYSLFLDLMILVQTAQVILWGKGAR